MFFYFPLVYVYVYSLSFIFWVVYFCCSVLFFKSGSHSVAHSGLEFIIELLQPSLPRASGPIEVSVEISFSFCTVSKHMIC